MLKTEKYDSTDFFGPNINEAGHQALLPQCHIGQQIGDLDSKISV
jgi:hypothetical protein